MNESSKIWKTGYNSGVKSVTEEFVPVLAYLLEQVGGEVTIPASYYWVPNLDFVSVSVTTEINGARTFRVVDTREGLTNE